MTCRWRDRLSHSFVLLFGLVDRCALIATGKGENEVYTCLRTRKWFYGCRRFEEIGNGSRLYDNKVKCFHFRSFNGILHLFKMFGITICHFLFCSGLNFQDLMLRQGVIDCPPKCPFVLGTECAGEIEQVGEGVEGFAVSFPIYSTPLLKFIFFSFSFCTAFGI